MKRYEKRCGAVFTPPEATNPRFISPAGYPIFRSLSVPPGRRRAFLPRSSAPAVVLTGRAGIYSSETEESYGSTLC